MTVPQVYGELIKSNKESLRNECAEKNGQVKKLTNKITDKNYLIPAKTQPKQIKGFNIRPEYIYIYCILENIGRIFYDIELIEYQ